MNRARGTAVADGYQPPVNPWLIAIAVLCVWVLGGWLPILVLGRPDGPGSFGDIFGAVNALFSGLAFAWLIHAVSMQSRELSLQREDLRATREELAAQREQMELQNLQIATQNFESTFFRLLRVLGEIVESVSSPYGNHGKSGFADFNTIVVKLIHPSVRALNSAEAEPAIVSAYETVYHRNENELSHYFRTLYSILKLVDRSTMPRKSEYTNLVRAQLSSGELGLIFFNGLSLHGREKLKPLLERYAMLKHLRDETVVRAVWRDCYAQQAYGAAASGESLVEANVAPDVVA